MTISALLIFLPGVVDEASLYVPTPYDAHGWAVRVRAKGKASPFFQCESPTHPVLEIIIINTSEEARMYTFLDDDAIVIKEIGVSLIKANGEYVRRYLEPSSPWKGMDRRKLQEGRRASRFLTLHQLGYRQMSATGEYTAQIEFRSDQGKVLSPPWKMTVLDVPADGVLESHQIKGYRPYMAKWPEAARARACVQQVQIGKRFFLLQRFFDVPNRGGKLVDTQQITELPGKVEMTVEGEYGDDKALIIRYRSSPKITTTLTVDSVNGTVWDRTDRPTRAGDLNNARPIAPAPRSVRP